MSNEAQGDQESSTPPNPEQGSQHTHPFQKRAEVLFHFGNQEQSLFSYSFTPGHLQTLHGYWSDQK